MKKIAKIIILITAVLFLYSCTFTTNGVTFDSISISFNVSNDSELLGQKIFLIYDYRDENIYYWDDFIINEENNFTWDDYGPYIFDRDDVATYDIAIRVGEDNKFNLDKETYLEFMFNVKGSNKHDLHRSEDIIIKTDYEDINATLDFNYSFGAWY